MKILDYLKNNRLYLDGAMGSLLQSRGLEAGELPEIWNISHSEIVKEIHKAYFDAGSNVVLTNTFGANSLKFADEELERVVKSAIDNAISAAKESKSLQEKWIALDVGPLGKLLCPYGDLEFETAVEIFSKTIKIGAKYGADLVFIETMGDSYETKAAVLAAKENCDLPIFVSCAFGEDKKMMSGADPISMISLLEGLGVDAIGVNCSFGPSSLRNIVDDYLKYSSLPVILKPNAGIPTLVGNKTEYSLTPDEFASEILPMAESGARILGGCCGTTPEYISALVELTQNLDIKPISEKNYTTVSSFTHAILIGECPVAIGERINPTGKPKLKEAIRSRNMEHILREAIAQEESGAHVLDVNIGIPEINEAELLPEVIAKIQSIIDLPLQIDTGDALAMEKSLRIYNGKALINSVNGKDESLNSVLPLAKKYGGVIVALTLDENGIPTTAEGRVEIAKKIIRKAEEMGISRKNLIFDPLAMSVSTDINAPSETLRALKIIREELGCNTVLGISNVSFGLPERELINASFLSLALSNGLSAAILNPLSKIIMGAFYSHSALTGLDDNLEKYIAFASGSTQNNEVQSINDLSSAIVKGLSELAASLTRNLLADTPSMTIINEKIIPALNTVGERYEKKELYLPGLLRSAEAASAAFEVIKQGSVRAKSYGKKIILATVKGDIHDIGKNILKLILENYNFEVIDLGKDVSPEKILASAIESSASLVGLSALMTTTLPAMEETVKLLKQTLPDCKVMVGGAVLTTDYANKIGADFYGKDAMEAVRYAESVLK